MRGSESDGLAFEAMRLLDEAFAIESDTVFTEKFLQTALSMMVLPLETQYALVECDSWKKCENRLNVLAAKDKAAKQKPSIFKRFRAWVGF